MLLHLTTMNGSIVVEASQKAIAKHSTPREAGMPQFSESLETHG